MGCPYCQGDATQDLERRTAFGYRLFRCRPCRRTFNERTGTPFNHLQVPTDIALLVVLWRLRYKLSLRDLAEMFLTRGFTFTHETVREWEERFAPLLTERLRAKRRGKCQWPHKSRHWWPSCACSLEGRWASSCSLKNKFSLSRHGLRVGGAWGTVGRFSTNGDH